MEKDFIGRDALAGWYSPAMTDTTPASPGSGEPQWTAGQALGFILTIPGLVLIVAACVAAMITAGLNDRDDAVLALVSCGAGAMVGVVMAVPGMIVFYKCRRQ